MVGMVFVVLFGGGVLAGQTASVPKTPPSPSRAIPVCADCHQEAKSQPGTSMAHALETAQECATLSLHPLLTFATGKYSYRIERQGAESLSSVSDGVQTLTMPIRWAMGASSAIGQTYILEYDGQFYESRVSFFSELGGLNITLGALGVPPAGLLDAAGRRMNHAAELQCFGCHATNATQGRQVTLEKMIAGVQCARCHGPAAEHAASMLHGPSPVMMKDLSKLSAEQMSDFCGQCHRTWEDVVAQGKFDINDIRFQPYRLAGSECYDPDDSRIRCVACHDPHREVNSNGRDYDSKCEACHRGGKPGARVCKVAQDRCTSCHMPKVELPGAHHKFTDHRIRIVKPNAPFPA